MSLVVSVVMSSVTLVERLAMGMSAGRVRLGTMSICMGLRRSLN